MFADPSKTVPDSWKTVPDDKKSLADYRKAFIFVKITTRKRRRNCLFVRHFLIGLWSEEAG